MLYPEKLHDFVGWAFPEIPAPAIEWVHSQAEGKGATNIWAPYPVSYTHLYSSTPIRKLSMRDSLDVLAVSIRKGICEMAKLDLPGGTVPCHP